MTSSDVPYAKYSTERLASVGNAMLAELLARTGQIFSSFLTL